MWLVLWLVACQPVGDPNPPRDPADPPPPRRGAPHLVGQLEDRRIVFQFDGGQIDLELYRDGTQIEQIARNRYAAPVTIRFTLDALSNVEATSALDGTAILPPAAVPLGAGEPVVLATLQQVDPATRYHRVLSFHGRFGDPRARPSPYIYGLPYPHGLTFTVLQGFHGAFSHSGSNEYAVDFNCPVATPVLAARDGTVIATNARAQGAGTSPEFLDDRRANFVIVQHGDGTLGEYMHLAPSGVVVEPGQPVRRGQRLGLSGNTGFSTTPHLHFQVMTAGSDGISKQSFPFELAISPRRSSPPIQGKRYPAWE
jgi:murein DD-endopeptidase MepM/ murein hydrolase activator NlpD